MAAIEVPAKIATSTLVENYRTVTRFEFPSKAVVQESESFILRNGHERRVQTEVRPKQAAIAQSKEKNPLKWLKC